MIAIDQEQYNWFKNHCINISEYVRRSIRNERYKERMKNEGMNNEQTNSC